MSSRLPQWELDDSHGDELTLSWDRWVVNESGIHDKLAATIDAYAGAYWGDSSPRPNPGLPGSERKWLNVQQTAIPQSSYFHVAMALRGEELTRLWRSESSDLAGRLFVWSEHEQTWIVMHEPAPSAAKVAAEVHLSATHEDKVTHRGLEHSRWFTRPHVWFMGGLGAASLLISLVTLHRHVDSVRSIPDSSIKGNTAAIINNESGSRSEERSRDSKHVSGWTTDVIPVTALPLVEPAGEITRLSALPLVGELGVAAQQGHATAHDPDRSAIVEVARAKSFDAQRARQVLDGASSRLARCAGSSELSGAALVTFEPSGVVADVNIQSATGDVSKISCVTSAFRAVHVPAFSGSRVTVKKSFEVN